MLGLSFEIIDKDHLARWLMQVSKRSINSGLTKGMQRAVRLVQTISKRSYLSGPRPEHLGVVTGRLRSSITVAVRSNIVSGLVEGVVGTNVKYAPIHEFGGVIVPRKAKYLAFKINGKYIRTKRVVIPARPFLRSALRDATPQIQQILGYEIEGAIERG